MAAESVRPDEGARVAGRGKNYKWIALSNTTLGILMVTINQSILLISLPALFRGIQLNPLVPSNTSYFLSMKSRIRSSSSSPSICPCA